MSHRFPRKDVTPLKSGAVNALPLHSARIISKSQFINFLLPYSKHPLFDHILGMTDKLDSISKSMETPLDLKCMKLAHFNQDSSHSDLNRSEDLLSTQKNDKSIGVVKTAHKLVKFSDEPEIEIAQHSISDGTSRSGNQSNMFGKIPPELSYLERRSNPPKALVHPNENLGKVSKKSVSLDDVPDLPSRAVKEISAVNKNTVLNFNYHEVVLPIGPDRILVEVKYSSLFSLDIAKIKKYTYNISNERIGIGYDFVGEIVELGKKFINHEKFKKGTKVFGVTNPSEKKGALQTCVIVNPHDILFEISDEDFEILRNIDILFPGVANSDFQIEDSAEGETDLKLLQVQETIPKLDIPPIAKFCTFGSQYCRAKQALANMEELFKRQASANILINGADTLLGKNIVQILTSSIYKDILQSYNITLVVKEKNMRQIESFTSRYNCGGHRNINIVAFDMVNEDLILPGESTPTNFKKVPFFATEIIDCILKIIPASEKVDKSNCQRVKLDLFVDIIGSKKMFQKHVDILRIDQVNFPFKSRLEEGLKLTSIFGKGKGPLFLKFMKPKAFGSSFVSFCDFELSQPSYLINESITYKGLTLDPWALSWTRAAANFLLSSYNYREVWELQIKKEWVGEAYKLVKAGEFFVQIDEVVEWRNDFRKRIDHLRKHDGLVLFKVESF